LWPSDAPKTARLQMAHLKQLIHEAHRRSLWQVLGIYVVSGWLILQTVDIWPVPWVCPIGHPVSLFTC